MKYISAFEIGTSGARICVIRIADNGQTHVAAKASIRTSAFQKNKLTSKEELTDVVKKLTAKLRTQFEFDVRSMFVAVPGTYVSYVSNTVSLDTENGTVSERDVAALNRVCEQIEIYEGEMVIGVLPERYVLDSVRKIKEPLGEKAQNVKLNAKVITAKRVLLESFREAIEAADVRVQGFVPSIIGIREVIPNDIKSLGSTLVIDVGASATEMALLYKNNLYVAGSFPLGGDNITMDIAQKLGVKYEEAESLKREYGIISNKFDSEDIEIPVKSAYSENMVLIKQSEITSAIELRVTGILKMIRARLEADNVDTNMIDRVVVSGDGISNFKNIELPIIRVFGAALSVSNFTMHTNVPNVYTLSVGVARYGARGIGVDVAEPDVRKINSIPDAPAMPETFWVKLKNKVKNIFDNFKV